MNSNRSPQKGLGGGLQDKRKKNLWEKQGEITRNHEYLINEILSEETEGGGEDEVDEAPINIAELIKSERFKDCIESQGRDGCNLLHALVKQLDHFYRPEEDPDQPDQFYTDLDGNTKRHISEEILELVEHIVVLNPHLIFQLNKSRTTPIASLTKSYPDIFFHMMGMLPSDKELEIFMQKCERTTSPNTNVTKRSDCPLKRLPKNLQKHFLKESEKDLSKLEKEDCLHQFINTKKLESKIVDIKKEIKEFVATTDQARTFLHILLGVDSFHLASASNDQVRHKAFEMIAGFFAEANGDVFNTPNTHGLSPLQVAVMHFNQGSKVKHELLYRTIKILVKLQPNSIYFKATENAIKQARNRTAYDLLRDLKGTVAKHTEAYTYLTKAENFLKKTCIQHMDLIAPNGEPIDKVKYLYSDKIISGRRLDFDLTHDISSIIDEEYIDILREKAAIQFETILECVKLPYRSPPPMVTEPPPDPEELERYHAEDPYISVFRWLRGDGKVEKIFKIEIDDIGDDPLNSSLLPHSNFAIRTCLNEDFAPVDAKSSELEASKEKKGLGVEIWDWKKLDICSDTIRQAAPKVKELKLYSSGNTAVLKAWACAEGLRNLKSLQKVHVTIYPKNRRDEVDCKRYLPDFEAKVRGGNGVNTGQQIEVEVDLKPPPSSNGADASSEKDSRENDADEKHQVDKTLDWIEKMSKFRECVQEVIDSISPMASQPVIKVAVIDDGVNIVDNGVQGIEKGESFDTGGQLYFSEKCKHGTHMVSSLRDVCPKARIFVARLDDSRKQDGQRFTVSSAIRALEWAIHWGVDIISMSWSFKPDRNSCTSEEEEKFKSLIDIASAKGIIMFGAMPDGEDVTKRYPASLSKVIRICAATENGLRLDAIHTSVPELLFPGEKVPVPESNFDITGSSVATALAAGFAALILICMKLQEAGILDQKQRGVNEKPSVDQVSLTERLKERKTTDGIRAIFKAFSKAHANTKDFLVQPYYRHEQLFQNTGTTEAQRKLTISNFLQKASWVEYMKI
ncbi:hypothetical protein H072_4034 [Dactylellina haptotyla CBS 200.50]|uniref:Peptidase S8/S53 domain-containing protein n=1 Tax=Dactylellina haptotyla (strain CBS 200.50) TaxID=1284197 RepID=S8AGL3_DACHA|nr:hypothetical protein H072_4034 [Dactylellina haptotyla CBS 200.50]